MMSFSRYEITLPIRYNDGTAIEPEKYLADPHGREVISQKDGVKKIKNLGTRQKKNGGEVCWRVLSF